MVFGQLFALPRNRRRCRVLELPSDGTSIISKISLRRVSDTCLLAKAAKRTGSELPAAATGPPADPPT